MIKWVYHQVGRDNYYQIWHQPKENIILYVHEGQGSVVTTDRVTPFTRGTLVFIGSKVDHYTLPDLSRRYVRSKALLDDVTLSQMAALLGTSFTPQDCIVGQMDDPQAIFDRMADHPTGGCLMLLEALHHAALPHPRKETTLVEQAIMYIHGHIGEEITVDGLCRAIPSSKSYLCRRFKAVTGLTVMQYILKTRVLLAKQRIEQGERNMAKIGDACGFACQSHFSRAFKAETGHSPLQYRKEIFHDTDHSRVTLPQVGAGLLGSTD